MVFLSDLRYAIRSLARSPGLALTLLLSIAVGIGSNAVVFGFIGGLVARRLPIPDMDRVVSIFARDPQNAYGPLSPDELGTLERTSSLFASLGAIRPVESTVVIGDRSEQMAIAEMTGPFLRMLDPSLTFPREGAVISHGVWQDVFGSRPLTGEEAIVIDGRPHAVAGVGPAWLAGLYSGRDVDIWLPRDPASAGGTPLDPGLEGRTLWAIGRLPPGKTARAAEIELSAANPSVDLAILRYTGIAPDVAGSLSRIGILLPAAAITVFLISCATVAGFLLSRSSGRSHETSVRVALGASRVQLGRLLLAESIVISVGGAALAALLAVWTSYSVPALFFAEDAEALVFAPNVGAIGAAAAISGAILMACGLAPLAEVRDDDPAAVLRRESGGLSNSARRVRAGLVIGQMACGCLLLIATGLMIDGFRAALRTASGNRIGRPMVAVLEANGRFEKEAEGSGYFRRAEATALEIDRVGSVAWVSALPGSRPAWQPVRVEQATTVRRDAVLDVAVFPAKVAAKRPVTAGRMFGGRYGPQSCRSVMINTAAAAAVFDGDAVGRSIEDPTGVPVEIIGVIDLPSGSPEDQGRPTVYYYEEQTPPPFGETGPQRFLVPARPPKAVLRAVLDANVTSRGYFEAVGLAPLDGEVFPSRVDGLGCRVGVVNQEAAERYFGGRAVGAAVIDTAGRRTRIIGVVPAAMLRASQRRPEPAIYYPMDQSYLPRMTMILGTAHPDAALVSSVERGLASVDGGHPLVVTTLDDYLAKTAFASERIATMLIGVSAALAMGLCLAGVYGAMTDSVRQRRREIAVRLALGAQGRRVVGQVLKDGLRLAVAGACAGMIGSLVVARWVSNVAHTARMPTVWVWLSVPLVLAAVLAVASVLPARRALSVDPLDIMRDS
jgi:predicted permease